MFLPNQNSLKWWEKFIGRESSCTQLNLLALKCSIELITYLGCELWGSSLGSLITRLICKSIFLLIFVNFLFAFHVLY